MAKAPEETAPKAMRVTNPELQAMAKIDEILAPLEDSSRNRVVAWIISTNANCTATFTSRQDPEK